MEGRGILPRAAEAIFSNKRRLEEEKSDTSRGSVEKSRCTVKLSVLEIYQEKLRDLLQTQQRSGDPPPQLRLREQANGVIWVDGLTELEVAEESDFSRCIAQAMKKRVVGAHSMNAVSSRSHLCCVVSLSIKQGERLLHSKMHLVDLAGSEMVMVSYLLL